MKDKKKIAYIVAHYNRDKTGEEIANHLGIHRKSLVRIVSELRVQGHHIKMVVPNHRLISMILILYGTMPTAELAMIIGMNTDQLRAYIQYIRDIGIIVRNAHSRCATNIGRKIARPVKAQPVRVRAPADKRYMSTEGDHRVVNHRNPDTIIIPKKKEDGRMVLVREHPRTWVWKPLSQLQPTF